MASGASYRVGEVAAYLGVAPKTARDLIDSGALPGYVVPGGNDRRVPRASLARHLAGRGDYLDFALRGEVGPGTDDFRSLVAEAQSIRESAPASSGALP